MLHHKCSMPLLSDKPSNNQRGFTWDNSTKIYSLHQDLNFFFFGLLCITISECLFKRTLSSTSSQANQAKKICHKIDGVIISNILDAKWNSSSLKLRNGPFWHRTLRTSDNSTKIYSLKQDFEKKLSSRSKPSHNQIGFIYLEIEEWSILLQNP